MKLSFIVPVYNVEQYLRKCVYSLVHQDFSDYEIVLIDDGSTDESGKICDELSESIRDERLVIRVIHQKNGGLSAARNAGLKMAEGEYVCFVDSDDCWEENVLGGLMAQIERDKLDVLRFDYRNVRLVTSERMNELTNERYEEFQPNKNPHPVDRSTEVVNGETYLNTRMVFECYAVMFIVRRTILIDNRCIDNRLTSIEDRILRNENCLFKEGIHYEDVEWLPRMMLRAGRVNSTTTIVYNYLIRGGSITQTQGNMAKIRKNLEDRLTIVGQYSKYIEKFPNCCWLKNMQGSMVAGALTTIAREFYQERREYIDRLKGMKVFPLKIADQGKTYMRRARLTNLLGAELYCALMHAIYR